MNDLLNTTPSGVSRRTFVKTSAAAAAGLMAAPHFAYAAGSDTLRIGVIGCGGRGTGAVFNCVEAASGVELVAMADLFQDHLDNAKEKFVNGSGDTPGIGEAFKVKDDHMFAGLDAYQKVLDADIDLVLIATPPYFRPEHFEAAVRAGKHIFMEKPIAVDPAGIRRVMATAKEADAKNLSIVVGLQRHHHRGYQEVIDQLHNGAIGDVVMGRVYWNQGGLWKKDRQPGWTDFEWQMRNWLYFTWLSGDHVVEQHIHNIDIANWVMQEHPIKANGVGGRQARVDPAYGHIYDHFAVEFEYPSGARVLSMCRQIDGTTPEVAEYFHGTKGFTNTNSWVRGETVYRVEGDVTNPYVQEHTDLIASIRGGEPFNEAHFAAESNLSAIMAREAAYTGQSLTWDEVLNADQDLTPPTVDFGPMMVPPVAVPGVTVVSRDFMSNPVQAAAPVEMQTGEAGSQ